MKYLSFLLLSLFIIGCSKAPVAVQQNSNAAPQTDRSERTQTVTGHSTENQPAPMPKNSSGPATSKWTQGGTAIDTSKFDATIDSAEKEVKSKPNDEAAKKTLLAGLFPTCRRPYRRPPIRLRPGRLPPRRQKRPQQCRSQRMDRPDRNDLRQHEEAVPAGRGRTAAAAI